MTVSKTAGFALCLAIAAQSPDCPSQQYADYRFDVVGLPTTTAFTLPDTVYQPPFKLTEATRWAAPCTGYRPYLFIEHTSDRPADSGQLTYLRLTRGESWSLQVVFGYFRTDPTQAPPPSRASTVARLVLRMPADSPARLKGPFVRRGSWRALQKECAQRER